MAFVNQHPFGVEFDSFLVQQLQLAVVDGPGASYDHLAGLEDEGSRLGVTDTDADRRETFRVVFSVAEVERNALEVKLAFDVRRRDNVAEGWALFQSNGPLLEHPVDVFRRWFILGNAGGVFGSPATRHVGSKLVSDDCSLPRRGRRLGEKQTMRS